MNFVGEPDDKDCRNTLFDLCDSAISDNAACGGGDSRCVMRETTHTCVFRHTCEFAAS